MNNPRGPQPLIKAQGDMSSGSAFRMSQRKDSQDCHSLEFKRSNIDLKPSMTQQAVHSSISPVLKSKSFKPDALTVATVISKLKNPLGRTKVNLTPTLEPTVLREPDLLVKSLN